MTNEARVEIVRPACRPPTRTGCPRELLRPDLASHVSVAVGVGELDRRLRRDRLVDDVGQREAGRDRRANSVGRDRSCSPSSSGCRRSRRRRSAAAHRAPSRPRRARPGSRPTGRSSRPGDMAAGAKLTGASMTWFASTFHRRVSAGEPVEEPPLPAPRRGACASGRSMSAHGEPMSPGAARLVRAVLARVEHVHRAQVAERRARGRSGSRVRSAAGRRTGWCSHHAW